METNDKIIVEKLKVKIPNGIIIRHCIGGIEIIKLPDDLVINHSLYLSDDQILYIPNGLHIKGDFIIKNPFKIINLPDELTVDGNFEVHNTEGLVFGKNNNIRGHVLNVEETSKICKKRLFTIDTNHVHISHVRDYKYSDIEHIHHMLNKCEDYKIEDEIYDKVTTVIAELGIKTGLLEYIMTHTDKL